MSSNPAPPPLPFGPADPITIVPDPATGDKLITCTMQYGPYGNPAELNGERVEAARWPLYLAAAAQMIKPALMVGYDATTNPTPTPTDQDGGRIYAMIRCIETCPVASTPVQPTPTTAPGVSLTLS